MIFNWAEVWQAPFAARAAPRFNANAMPLALFPLAARRSPPAGDWKARYVIHAASMRLGGATTANALRSATAHSLRIAAQNNLKTIAFPAVGTGIAGFPMNDCAEIMLGEAAKHLQEDTSLGTIYFVLFDASSLATFERGWKKMKEKGIAASRK